MLQPGEVLLGKYRITRLVGRGSWADVYEAQDQLGGPRVAIKMLRRERPTVEGRTARFAPDAARARRITSQHVATVFETGEHGPGRPFVVTEYLLGEDLRSRIARRGPLSPSDAANLVIKILNGLADAHESGVAHGNLVPDNVYLVRNALGAETVKIVDFGIVWKTDDPTGPPAPIADEALGGLHADVAAVGALLFEAITGKAPFDGHPAWIDPAPPLPDPRSVRSELDPDFSTIVMRTANAAPNGFVTAREFHFALTHWLQRSQRGNLVNAGGEELEQTPPSVDLRDITPRPDMAGAGAGAGAGTDAGAGAGVEVTRVMPGAPVRPTSSGTSEPPPRDRTEPIKIGEEPALFERSFEQQRRRAARWTALFVFVVLAAALSVSGYVIGKRTRRVGAATRAVTSTSAAPSSFAAAPSPSSSSSSPSSPSPPAASALATTPIASSAASITVADARSSPPPPAPAPRAPWHAPDPPRTFAPPYAGRLPIPTSGTPSPPGPAAAPPAGSSTVETVQGRPIRTEL
jgi:serine/threonine-protein kinase